MIYITGAISKDSHAAEKFLSVETALRKRYGFGSEEIINPERKFKHVYELARINGHCEDDSQRKALDACLNFLRGFDVERDFLVVICDRFLASSYGCQREMDYLRSKGLKEANVIRMLYVHQEKGKWRLI